MSWFSTKEYWKYLWQAKGRHGVHSPLVYSLVDVGLKHHSHVAAIRCKYQNELGTEWSATGLMTKIVAHFQFSEIKKWEQNAVFSCLLKGNSESDLSFDCCYDFSEQTPEEVFDFFQRNLSIFKEQDVFCVGKIHESKAALASWNILQEQPQVSLSLDFYSLGILFFSKKIKERQHFILRS